MGRPRRSHCRLCERHVSECGSLSARGKCVDCAVAAVTENVVGLAHMSGEPVKRWRHGMAASVGAVLPDDPAA